jgi:hypothetical protein
MKVDVFKQSQRIFIAWFVEGRIEQCDLRAGTSFSPDARR